MSEKYTPRLEDLRADWVWAQTQFGDNNTDKYNEEFLRIIAKIKAIAWDEGYDAGHFVAEVRGLEDRPNPYEEQQ